MGVFLVTIKNVFVPVKRILSRNTYSGILTIPRGSEVREWSAAKRVSGVSGACRNSQKKTHLVYHLIIDHYASSKKNKAGYTATEVACGWAGAIFEITKPLGQEH